MKKFFLLFIIIISILQAHTFAQVKNAAVYGQHKTHVKTLEDNTLRIFMDMNGDFYPENYISNEELLEKGESQLAIWSKNYPENFKLIAESYELQNTSYSEANYSVLQDSIRSSITNLLNQAGTTRQTWIIHGFRKKISEENIDNFTSVSENVICRNRINSYLPKDSDHLFVEVYWDGKYMLIDGFKSAIKLGSLFKNEAIPNAKTCGYSLRSLFSDIDCQQINIISHSTGTHVVSSLLFNINKNYTKPTPNQSDIRVALTASASSGKKQFKNYYDRNTNLDYRSKDNYSLFNLMNESDFVLLKQRGRIKLAKRSGNTTLGCNHQGESKELKDYFTENFPSSSFQEGYVTESGSHWFQSYIKSKGFDEVLRFLYE